MNTEGTLGSTDPTAVPAAVPEGSIVVGHDGSDCSDRALTEALELALQLHTPVVVVRTWTIDTAPRPANWEFGYVSSFAEYAASVEDSLRTDVAPIATRFTAVSLGYRVVHSGAAKGLIEISRPARMLVVGSRGHGGFTGMLLGSVSDQCVRHSTCPVLVVRPRT
ncbi:universal stress protein [Cryobacterium sp. MLB-32]|uniref:universal stress protein n=1 Tax=Cryobacterium sp. MLB-32 TaxID=1529318 RepID=UPI000A6E75AC|nr:universal stress protein [Cryobacterium sp. MLB-32]